jgi:arsenate reductase
MLAEVRWLKDSSINMLQKEIGRLVLVAELNPLAVNAMKEVGIDISHQKSKDITEDMMRNSTKIVNMGCMDKESCPTLFLNNVIDWNIEDPKGKSVDKVREISDEIERRVKEFVSGLKASQEINI